eukprot:COSAG02_NODE_45113_length_360_cov_0.704981_1_plen_43_part_10
MFLFCVVFRYSMLQVGDIGLSVTEQRSHFALWSLMASPLLIGS